MLYRDANVSGRTTMKSRKITIKIRIVVISVGKEGVQLGTSMCEASGGGQPGHSPIGAPLIIIC